MARTGAVVSLGAGIVLAFFCGSVAAAYPTDGGARGRIITVTSLADSGPGSLREALATPGPRVVRFSIAGEIWLQDALNIKESQITVEGESAPSPGITLMGEGLHIKADNVIVRHLRVRVGALLTGSEPQNRDGIAINGGHNILIENCSVSWAQDENIQVWGEENRGIVIRNCLVAEALHHSLHPKGRHSAGLIVGPGTDRFLIQGNLFASNAFRNPVVTSDSSGFILNNLISNPGAWAIHVYGRDGPFAGSRLVTAIIGNRILAGPNTRENVHLFQKKGLNPGSEIYLADNWESGTAALDPEVMPPGWAKNEPSPFVKDCPLSLPEGIRVLPVGEVEESVLANCGARPSDRDETDRRIIAEVTRRGGQLVDIPPDPRLIASSSDKLPGALEDFRQLLAKYVTADGVRLAEWRQNDEDLNALEEVLRALTKTEPADLAASLNAYNAARLHQMLDLGVETTAGREASLNTNGQITIAGRTLTLETFAQEILDRYPDPRVPFALSSGTRGGPPLFPSPFWQPYLRTQLDLVIGAFVNSDRGVIEAGEELRISLLFKREEERFPNGTIAFIKKYSGKYPRATEIHYLPPDETLDASP